MGCDCSAYIDCDDTSLEVATYDSSNAFSHSVDHSVMADDVIECYQKTERQFSATHGWDRAIDPGFVLRGCTSDGSHFICDQSEQAIPSATCSEYCVRESNVPWYWDRQRGICVWKHVREVLDFSITSDKTAQFKMKWGTSRLHKIIIPTSVRTTGIEQFIMLKDGVKTVLAEVQYDYNPFPVNDVAGGNWGLYGNVVNNVSSPDAENVACILVFPTPPKLAMCQDADCLYYGFYDYNAVEGGFVENSLPKDDGGKDYFYPYWCRAMPTDPLWRQVADQRYEVIYSAGKLDLSGTTSWTPDEPTSYPLPFGSFALNSKADFIASCILQFGEHSGSKGVVYNEASMGDLFAALTKTGVALSGPYTALHPVTPL